MVVDRDIYKWPYVELRGTGIARTEARFSCHPRVTNAVAFKTCSIVAVHFSG